MEPVGCMKQNFEFVRRSENIPLSGGMTGVINAAPGRCRIRKPKRQNLRGKTCNQEQKAAVFSEAELGKQVKEFCPIFSVKKIKCVANRSFMEAHKRDFLKLWQHIGKIRRSVNCSASVEKKKFGGKCQALCCQYCHRITRLRCSE